MSKVKVAKEASVLISQFFGEYTATLYYNFYKGKDCSQIMLSLEELLVEMVGPLVAQKKISEFRKKFEF